MTTNLELAANKATLYTPSECGTIVYASVYDITEKEGEERESGGWKLKLYSVQPKASERDIALTSKLRRRWMSLGLMVLPLDEAPYGDRFIPEVAALAYRDAVGGAIEVRTDVDPAAGSTLIPSIRVEFQLNITADVAGGSFRHATVPDSFSLASERVADKPCVMEGRSKLKALARAIGNIGVI